MQQNELQADAIVDFFKEELKGTEFGFIDQSDHSNIESWLDSLCDSNERRYNKAKEAGEMWKFFVKKSLERITKNLRGYNELCHYFDEYIEYENLLFALDEKYRDHTIHSIWVMLIGLYLRKKCCLFNDMDYPVWMAAGKDETVNSNDVVQTKGIINEYETPLWCLIALTHDLGYPIQKTAKANKIMSDMIKHFGFLRQLPFDYNFTIVHQTAINQLLNILSTAVVWSPAGHAKIIYNSGMRVDYAKSFERLDHGIMGAYLLQLYLDCVCEMYSPHEGADDYVKTDHNELAHTAMTVTFFRAISAHTNKNVYTHGFNDMETLLFVSDELDEFSRFSRSLKTNEWVDVKCRTAIQWSENTFQMNYTFDNSDIDYNIESFFREKVKKMHYRIESDSENNLEISITCSDITKSEPDVFEYKKTPSDDVVKIRDRSWTDIIEYLTGK